MTITDSLHFTGLIPEDPAVLSLRLAEQIEMPVCAGSVDEKLWDEPPSWNRIEYQRRTNMCAVNAGTTAAEVIEYQKTGQLVQRSRNYLYARSAKYCGIYSDSGRTLGSVIQAFKQDGCPPEDMYPFDGSYNPRVPAGCDKAAQEFKLTTTIDVRSGGYNSVRTLIGQNMGTVLMASYWPFRYWDGYRVERYQPTGSQGHAEAFVFLSSKLDANGRPYVWLANSHSEQAQHNGYSLWSPDAIDELLSGDTWGITGLSDMTTPQPREVDWTGLLNPFAK